MIAVGTEAQRFSTIVKDTHGLSVRALGGKVFNFVNPTEDIRGMGSASLYVVAPCNLCLTVGGLRHCSHCERRSLRVPAQWDAELAESLRAWFEDKLSQCGLDPFEAFFLAADLTKLTKKQLNTYTMMKQREAARTARARRKEERRREKGYVDSRPRSAREWDRYYSSQSRNGSM